ncbi:E3 ubiquitin-protein ligase PPP1R11 [Wyeomyia smithii]|uniref:E3 ubiquitin-protein ligase PPP1R11 n=1 Tax=Wyeomyia smithii TaxID=174621 RepID=UPI0024681B37|nr:E3 ubiquitin-protein ligase PPP1R11 [Wyeomyia smithii]
MSSDNSSSAMHSDIIPAAAGNVAVTETITQDQIPGGSRTTERPVLRLRLQKPRSSRKVQWTNGTVDNEHLNRKKSKCCCIYKKPLQFGESSSESEDECEHCFGHVELKKKNKQHPVDSGEDSVDSCVNRQCTIETENELINDSPVPVQNKDDPGEPKDNELNAT